MSGVALTLMSVFKPKHKPIASNLHTPLISRVHDSNRASPEINKDAESTRQLIFQEIGDFLSRPLDSHHRVSKTR